VALRELLAVRAEDHPEMREPGQRGAEGPEERHMLRRVRQVVVAPDDVRDPHVRVVDADAEVVERVAVRAHEDEVVDRVGGELDGAPDQVVDDDRLGGNPEPHDVALAGARAALALLGRDRATGARVPVGAACGFRFLPLGVEFLRGLERPVRLSFGDQAVGRRAVEVVPLRLVVGALVVVESDPVHGRQDLCRQLLARALDVRVLDPEDERAFFPTREEEVVECRSDAADV
jgi:hypothetical protein